MLDDSKPFSLFKEDYLSWISIVSLMLVLVNTLVGINWLVLKTIT